MKMPILFLLFVTILTTVSGQSCAGNNIASIRRKIASIAESYVGSTIWCFSCPSGHGRNTNKCNYFVYDVGQEADAKMPERSFARGPVGAGEGGWGKASTLDNWTRVSSPQPGDIVAAHHNQVYHVGIYVVSQTTVSANSKDIGRKNWPYGGEYSDIVYWRYTG